MAGITNNLHDWRDMYTGWDIQRTGLGLIDPNIYASEAYRQQKQQILLLGCISDIIYNGFDHDATPQILSIAYESQYATVLAYNLHYLAPQLRQQLVKYVVNANIGRMHQNLPMIIPYQMIKAAMPYTENVVRRYKAVGIKVIGNVPVSDWPKAIKGTNKWQNVYKGVTVKK